MFGGAEEDRTPDLRIANATLSQLSYRPIVLCSPWAGPLEQATAPVFGGAQCTMAPALAKPAGVTREEDSPCGH